MARNNNLQDLLKDTADAIREKKGTSDLIKPYDFPEEIASIETGGGGLIIASDENEMTNYLNTLPIGTPVFYDGPEGLYIPLTYYIVVDEV